MYAISRFQCGVTINPKEYVRDKNNEVIKFTTKDEALKFLIPHFNQKWEITDELIEIFADKGMYIEEETKK